MRSPGSVPTRLTMLLTMLLLLSPLGGCSDYELHGKQVVPGAGSPDIDVDPTSAFFSGLCDAEQTEITASNVGDADLTISAVEIAGSGWEVRTEALPIVLAPGESTVMRLTTTGGDATLRISSDDPDESAVNLPLTAEAGGPPVVEIVAPAAGEILPEAQDVAVIGAVSDGEDAPGALSLVWSTDAAGVLDRGAAAADGSAGFRWAAADRLPGAQTLTLEATDTCGLSASASVTVCQDGAFTYDALALSSWHYEGQSRWDSYNNWLQLTDATGNVVGSAFETGTTVSGDQVDISFSFYIGGGTGADGISLTALDTARMTGFLGGTGCGIGYGGDAPCTAGPALPGWSIEVDTYYNEGQDPTADDHLMFTFDGDVDDPAIWASLPEMEDTGWHTMEVYVSAPHVYVSIDGVPYFDTDLSGFTPFPAYVGFTAGTGGLTNNHLIDALQVTDYYCGD